MREPQTEAVRLLADMAARDWPEPRRIQTAASHHVPVYDQRGARHRDRAADRLVLAVPLAAARFQLAAREEFTEAWAGVLPLAAPARRVWTLRDYHSPNLSGCPSARACSAPASSIRRTACSATPPTISPRMLQDARVDRAARNRARAPRPLLRARAARASTKRSSARPMRFSAPSGRRKSSASSPGCRKRDGKHGYLKHMPRVSRLSRARSAASGAGAAAGWYDDASSGHIARGRGMSRPRARHGARGGPRPAHAAADARGPKPLIEVKGKALIDYGFDICGGRVSRRPSSTSHYLPEQIEAWAARQKRTGVAFSDERASCSIPAAASPRRCRCSERTRSSC